MAKAFRTKSFTTRTTSINSSQINRLRQTQLKRATSASQRRFINSNEFAKQLRRNIKTNRFNKNVSALNRITSQLGQTQDQKKFFQSFFGEKTRYTKNGKRTTNSFTSQSQTRRLAQIEKQLKKGNFSLIRRVANTKDFKETREFLPDNPSQQEIVSNLTNTVFYYENKSDIKTFNNHVRKVGYKSASRTKVGKQLSDTYLDSLNTEDASLFANLIKK